MDYINVEGLGKAGPYTHAVASDDMLFISGMIGDGSTVSAQLISAFNKVDKILQRAGMSRDNIVKVTVYLSEGSLFSEMNEEYSRQFPIKKPARTTIIAKPPVEGALLEVEVIASKH